jgi:hypothetical protein
MSHRERSEGTVHDMQQYLVSEFIEEYEDGTEFFSQHLGAEPQNRRR